MSISDFTRNTFTIPIGFYTMHKPFHTTIPSYDFI